MFFGTTGFFRLKKRIRYLAPLSFFGKIEGYVFWQYQVFQVNPVDTFFGTTGFFRLKKRIRFLALLEFCRKIEGNVFWHYCKVDGYVFWQFQVLNVKLGDTFFDSTGILR